MFLIQIERCLTCFEDFNREMAFQIVTKQVQAKQHEKTTITNQVDLIFLTRCSICYFELSSSPFECAAVSNIIDLFGVEFKD